MKTKLALYSACAFALGVLSSAAAATAESIETSLRNMLRALDAGDRAGALAYGPSPATRFPVLTFDYDFDNKPVVFEGAEAMNAYIGSLFDDMAKRNMKVVSVISNLRSGSSSSELGFASFELTQTMTAEGKSETSKYRITALLSQDNKTNKWRIFHWHATLMPAAAVATK